MRRSVSGYVIYLEEAHVMHRCAMQKTVALSLHETELNAAVLCVQDMLYTKNLLKSVGLKVKLPIMLEINNKVVVDLINSFTVGVPHIISMLSNASFENSRSPSS